MPVSTFQAKPVRNQRRGKPGRFSCWMAWWKPEGFDGSQSIKSPNVPQRAQDFLERAVIHSLNALNQQLLSIPGFDPAQSDGGGSARAAPFGRVPDDRSQQRLSIRPGRRRQNSKSLSTRHGCVASNHAITQLVSFSSAINHNEVLNRLTNRAA